LDARLDGVSPALIVHRRGPDLPGRARPSALAAALAAFLVVSACSTPLAPSNTRESPQAVARAVVGGLAAKDFEALRALAVNEAEFRELIWPKLPASRPERNVPVSYAWEDLRAKSDAHLRALVNRWQDRGYDVVSVSFTGGASNYGTFLVHRDSLVVLRDQDGQTQSGRLFGSMLEMNGRFKVFSYVVD
jgi:hypothetical protein